MAEETWEKVQSCRRGKVPLLARPRGGGVDHYRKLPEPECKHAWGLRGRGSFAQATGGEKPLACLGEMRYSLCRLQVAGHLLCGLKALGC